VKIQNVDPAELTPADYNPRSISEHQAEALKRSLDRWGFVEPIVANKRTGRIVGGHQRLDGALALALPKVPVHWIDVDESSEKALNIALNKISGDWDEDLLGKLLAELELDGQDLEDLGFDADELQEIIDAAAPEPELNGDLDDIPEPPAEPITQPGDLWQLGEHRLLCGDSTKAEDVARLMGDAKASAIWTDPPYGVDHIGGTKDPRRDSHRSGGVVHNDDLKGGDLVSLVSSAVGGIPKKDNCVLYMASPPGSHVVDMIKAFDASGFGFRHSLAWVKSAFVFGRADYHYQHELILYGWAKSHKWTGPRNLSTVFDFRRGDKSVAHPTSKPVGLVSGMISNHPKGLVVDPFSGSGTTIIAAEQTGRKCYAMELSPAYCDVAVKRWEQATGRKAERVE
jgi:DNA modification methylase